MSESNLSRLSGGPRSHFVDASQPQVQRYRTLSGWAVGALIFGLLSALALLHLGFLVLALMGVLSGAIALGQIARNAPEVIGRPLAVTGLLLSVFLASAAVAQDATLDFCLRREARQFGSMWLDLLQQQKPHLALVLTRPPSVRPRMDESVWAEILSDENAYKALQGFVDDRGIHTLLALGEGAQIRYFDTERQTKDRIWQLFAVSYDDAGTKKSFFVRLVLKRLANESTHRANWVVDSREFGVRPRALRDQSVGRVATRH